MIHKNIGGTDVSAIGLGTYGLKDMPWILLKMAFANGITFIDTAENYNTEEMIGKVIKKNERAKVFIATKVSPEHLSYDNVLKSAESSLRKLQTDYIDLYQIHWPNPAIRIDETMSAMNKLVKDGKIRYIGVSNFSIKQLRAAREISVISAVQNEYNLFDRTAEDEMLPYCNDANIAFIAYKPLDCGHLIPYSVLKELTLLNMSIRYRKSIASIILRWLVSHKPVMAIPKTSNVSHLRENADVDYDFDENDIKLLGRTFKTKVVDLSLKDIWVDSSNLEHYIPNPEILAQSLLNGDELKPIRVSRHNGKYVVVEGKARYWAYMLANRDKIKAIIR